MGIIQTDEWLAADFDHPSTICEKIKPHFKGLTGAEIYHQLTKFGMYRPSNATRSISELLMKRNIWGIVNDIYKKYKVKWAGPDIPIYLFPIGQQKGVFSRQEEKVKGGVSYPDKMFLFLSDKVNMKELEALFVHEYHHVCRLNTLNKEFKEYTLMDSIIIEGLAEYAVLVNCGNDYLADWCRMYTDEELQKLWDKYLKKHLEKKKMERGHDELLFGFGRVPKLLGYAAGFKIVENYYMTNHYSTKLSFSLPSKKFIGNKEFSFKKSR